MSGIKLWVARRATDPGLDYCPARSAMVNQHDDRSAQRQSLPGAYQTDREAATSPGKNIFEGNVS